MALMPMFCGLEDILEIFGCEACNLEANLRVTKSFIVDLKERTATRLCRGGVVVSVGH